MNPMASERYSSTADADPATGKRSPERAPIPGVRLAKPGKARVAPRPGGAIFAVSSEVTSGGVRPAGHLVLPDVRVPSARLCRVGSARGLGGMSESALYEARLKRAIQVI